MSFMGGSRAQGRSRLVAGPVGRRSWVQTVCHWERRAPKAVAKAGAGTEPATLAPPAPPVPMLVKGIVKFPGGAMAIVNDQIVKVGDLVNGHRVDEIADGRVLLKEPGGAPRAATLPNFATAVPAKDPPGR